MALECGNDVAGLVAEKSGRIEPVAVFGEQALELGGGGAAVAGLEHGSVCERRGFDPMADTRLVELAPGKFLARILLAARRHVGMREHAVRSDAMPGGDIAAEHNHLANLRLGKVRIAELVPRIGDLDADRARVDVLLALPGGNSCMPRAPRLRHALDNAAILPDEIMRGYEGVGIIPATAQALERSLRSFHAGVMQHDHVGMPMAAPLAVVRRGLNLVHG